MIEWHLSEKVQSAWLGAVDGKAVYGVFLDVAVRSEVQPPTPWIVYNYTAFMWITDRYILHYEPHRFDTLEGAKRICERHWKTMVLR